MAAWHVMVGELFLEKNPSKVDRSAAYALRQVAKSLVAAGLCDYCEIQASYAIGIPEPTSIFVNTFESEKFPIKMLEKLIMSNFDLTPAGIISALKLNETKYQNTSTYGHFGREDQGLLWEEIIASKIKNMFVEKTLLVYNHIPSNLKNDLYQNTLKSQPFLVEVQIYLNILKVQA